MVPAVMGALYVTLLIALLLAVAAGAGHAAYRLYADSAQR